MIQYYTIGCDNKKPSNKGDEIRCHILDYSESTIGSSVTDHSQKGFILLSSHEYAPPLYLYASNCFNPYLVMKGMRFSFNKIYRTYKIIMFRIQLIEQISTTSYTQIDIYQQNIMYFTYLAILFTIANSASIFTLYKHPENSPAKCLDGSPAALYYFLGSSANQDKVILFFQGGGFCGGSTLTSTLESCYQRSNTDLGSSLKYPSTRDFENTGILSSNSKNNPDFHDWSKVFIPYCDGSLHQGSKLSPISYKDKNLYFRGTNNTLEHLKHLNNTYGLYHANSIIVTGVSAGGLATFIWSNHIHDQSVNKNVFSVPDSGIFVTEFVNPFTGRQQLIYNSLNLFEITNKQTPMPIPQCVQDHPTQLECFSAGHLGKYLKNPFFIVQSQYDQYCIGTVLALKCVPSTKPSTLTKCNDSQKAAVQSYRQATLQAINNLTSYPKIGVWSPSCVQHGFIEYSSFNSKNYEIPTNTGTTIPVALAQFLRDPSANNIYIDRVAWPHNTGCSGIAGQRSHIRTSARI